MAGLATAAAALTLLRATALPAQTAVISGTVRDSAGAPVANAQVRAGDGGRGALTDGGGRFRLAAVPAGRVVLQVSRVGYRRAADTVTVASGDSLVVDVTLAAAALVTEAVVVTAAKRSQLLEQAVTSVAVVSAGDLARRAATNVDEAVDKAPGVQFLNGQVNIRGSSGYVQGLGSRVLLLVDGVPANQGDRGGINWDLVPLDDVDRVEVVKGAGSSLYGSAAFGGVVNLITRDIRPGGHARVRATGGAYANPPYDVWRFRDHTGGHGGLDVTGSYGGATLRGSLTAGGRHSDGYREQDRRDHWETAGKAEWLPSGTTRLTASGSWASDQYETPLIWCARNCEDRGQAYQPFKVATCGRGASTRSDKGYLAGTLERAPSERLTWQARGSWLRTHFVDHQPGNGCQPDNTDAAVSNRFGAELRGIVRSASEGVATVGAEGARSDVASDIFGDHAQNEIAAYGESEQRLGRARVTAGGRIDFLVVDGGAVSAVVSPRAGIVLSSGPHSVWRASAGRGFRAPSLAERFVNTRAFGFQVIPNPGLDPETAWSFELGHATSAAGRARLDAALFWTEARHLIEPRFTVQDSVPKIQFQNVARARLRGLDLSVAATPLMPRLTATLAYTLLDARDLSRDTVLAFRPRHLVTLSADYVSGRVGVGGDYRHASRIERIELEQFFGGDPRIASHVLDLRAHWARDPFSLHALVTNALNYIYNQVPRTLAPVRTLSVVLTWTY